MPGEHLHQFDLQLCAYAVENVVQHMDRPRFAAQVDKILATRPFLLDYIKNASDKSLDAKDVRYILNDNELNSLTTAVEFAPHLLWQADPELHRRYVATLKEARDNLSGHAAEDWSERCVQFRRELEAERVRLPEGISVVREWVQRLRALLRAMGAVELLAAPEGRLPTPTNPALPAPTTPSTDAVAPLQPAGPVSLTQPVPGIAATLAHLTDAINNISAPAATQLPPPEALSKPDAAKFLGISVKSIEYLIRARKIEYVQLGSQRGRVLPVEALRKYLQDNIQLTAQEELRRRGRR